MDKIPIIMDVDTGVDDAMAIMLALSSKKLDVLGITTVAGNQTLDKTTRNTLQILELTGRTEIPVAAGADHPLFVPLRTAGNIHGESGLGNVSLPQPVKKTEPTDAAGLQRKLIEASPRPVVLVPTGPLTNIAILLKSCPHLKSRIEKIVLMGGGAYRGNATPSAEFNVYTDPEAARIVFDAGIPIVMCGLDVTMQAVIYDSEFSKFEALGNREGDFCSKAFQFYSRSYKRVGSLRKGCAVHDAVTIMYLIHPEIMEGKDAKVEVDIDGGGTYGCTVTDLRPENASEQKNAFVLLKINRERFLDTLLSSIGSYAQPTAECRQGG